jgi:hypothetical protein
MSDHFTYHLYIEIRNPLSLLEILLIRIACRLLVLKVFISVLVFYKTIVWCFFMPPQSGEHIALHLSVCPYEPRGTCVTWKTMDNSKFSLILFIPFLLVCLFLSLVWLKMAKKIKGKVTKVPFCEYVPTSQKLVNATPLKPDGRLL